MIAGRLAELVRRNLRQDAIYGYSRKYGVQRDALGDRVAYFLVVRFNLYSAELRRRARLDDPDRYAQWELFRARVFRDILLPSVVGQTIDSFHVLAFFDTKLTAPINGILRDMAALGERFVPVFVDQRPRDSDPFAFEESLRQAVAARKGDAVAIATSRLDSDDAINVGYFETLRAYVSEVPQAVALATVAVNFPFGVQVAGRSTRILTYNRNPFLTLIEPAANYDAPSRWTRKGVFQFAHDRADKNHDVLNPITLLPMWAQFVHGGNVMNTVNQYAPELRVSAELDAMFAGSLSRMMSSVLGK